MKILFILRKKKKEKLDRFTSLGIIEQVEKEEKVFILVSHSSESKRSKQ